MTMPRLDAGEIVVRQLRQDDLSAMIALDAKITGRRREQFLRTKLRQVLEDTGVQLSLVAEVDGVFAGFVLARVFYGEFGAPEPSAVLDTLDVRPDLARRGVGRALLRQLCTNLRGLGVPRLDTEVGWDQFALMGFFHEVGFAPAPRLCLTLDITSPLPYEQEDAAEPG
jgi:predicted N-acetyltransferase YhbS